MKPPVPTYLPKMVRVLDQVRMSADALAYRKACKVLIVPVAKALKISPAIISYRECGHRGWPDEAAFNKYVGVVTELANGKH